MFHQQLPLGAVRLPAHKKSQQLVDVRNCPSNDRFGNAAGISHNWPLAESVAAVWFGKRLRIYHQIIVRGARMTSTVTFGMREFDGGVFELIDDWILAFEEAYLAGA